MNCYGFGTAFKCAEGDCLGMNSNSQKKVLRCMCKDNSKVMTSSPTTVALLGRSPHKDCKNDLDDQT